eukprot:m.155223 g.155223  ORF g.155223 m.155223 type:complete len:166 (+) comp10202_c1_seq1:1025-1522(+)
MIRASIFATRAHRQPCQHAKYQLAPCTAARAANCRRLICCHQAIHDGATNSIAFSPFSENLILTAGFDKTIRLWDERAVNKPLFVFEGHHLGKKRASLSTPWFYRDCIMTHGTDSPYLSFYCTKTGVLDRQAYVGFTPDALLVESSLAVVAAQGSNAAWRFTAGF